MTPGTLTTTLNNFASVFSLGWGNLLPSTTWLFITLLAIEIVFTGINWALGSGNPLQIIKKILFIGIWIWIVFSFPTLVNALIGSLVQAGAIAGGGTAFNLLNPSAIVNQGFIVAEPILNQMGTFDFYNVPAKLIYFILWFIVLLIYFIIAIQVFITVLEFYIITAIIGIFMPFGLNNSTKFLAEKSIGAIIASGIKMMVLSFILTVSASVITTATLPPAPDYNSILSVILTIGAIAFLVWNAPGIAAGLISGSPSLTAGTAVQNTFAAGMIGAGAGMAAANMARGAANATASAAKMGASTFGAASAGSDLALAASSSTNPVSRAATGLAGSIYGVGSAAVNQAKGGIGKVGQSLSNSSINGARSAVGMAPRNTSSSSNQRSQAPPWAARAARMHHSIPQEARPSGGNINPRL